MKQKRKENWDIKKVVIILPYIQDILTHYNDLLLKWKVRINYFKKVK